MKERLNSLQNLLFATVTDLKKNEAKIRSFVLSMESLSVSSKQRKIMCLADDEEVDEALYLCYVQKRFQGIPVTGPILREKSSNVLPTTSW